MSFGLPIAFLKRLGSQAIIAANRRVARRFVPGYATAAAIRLAADARRTLERRQFSRLIAPRRAGS
jgi:hypothetical protein